MTDKEVAQLLVLAIEVIKAKDKWLLEKNINEPSISHKLAETLQMFFPDYNVDCEYDGNIESDIGKKKIFVIKREIVEAKIKLNKGEEETAIDDILIREVLPDIIIHKRGTNEKNLCIIEVKKSKSALIDCIYDEIKLQSYTTNYNNNELNYQIGAFLEFETGKQNPRHRLHFYKNGRPHIFD